MTFTQFSSTNVKIEKTVPVEWKRLIDFAEKIKYGQIKITVQNKKPVRIDYAVKQIKLDEDFDEKMKVIPLT